MRRGDRLLSELWLSEGRRCRTGDKSAQERKRKENKFVTIAHSLLSLMLSQPLSVISASTEVFILS